MYFGFFGLVLLAPIGYVLMYGGFGLPARGAQGSGMATAIVLWMQLVRLRWYIALRRHYRDDRAVREIRRGRTGTRSPTCCAWACRWASPC